MTLNELFRRTGEPTYHTPIAVIGEFQRFEALFFPIFYHLPKAIQTIQNSDNQYNRNDIEMQFESGVILTH